MRRGVSIRHLGCAPVPTPPYQAGFYCKPRQIDTTDLSDNVKQQHVVFKLLSRLCHKRSIRRYHREIDWINAYRKK